MGIRGRALLLFSLLGALPLAVSFALLWPDYGRAVRESEDQLQLATVSELAALVARRFRGVREDAEAIAAAVSHAALLDDPAAGEALMKSALSARTRVDAARFEVPSAGVDTVLAKEGAATEGIPRSSEATRARALGARSAYAAVDATRSALVVAVPRVTDGGAPAWLTVPLYVKPFGSAVAEAVAVRDFGPETNVAVVDRDRRVIASVGQGVPGTGEDGSGLAVWASLPDGTVDAGVAIKNEFESEGVPMVGALHVVPELGWTVAMWRPKAVAMAGYTEARTAAVGIGVVALLLALGAGWAASRAVTRPVLELVARAKRIGQRRWDELRAPSPRRDELGQLGDAMHQMADDLQTGERELEKEVRLRSDLSRFMSQEVVDGIVGGDLSLELGGRRRPVTVLFADMVAFTTAAEQAPPERVVAMLNELFSVLTEVVFRHGGTVDKFIGDCLMAIWGAPVSDDDHALKALDAAEDMMRFLEAGRSRWLETYGVEMRLAVGVNSGDAIVGNVGSRERMEYTVIGDVVNVAARLEGIAAPGQVLLTAETVARAGDGHEFRRLGARTLTGRSEEVEIYELAPE
ncbi:MAG: adenylate/guanylate cyclase domain-containing protein [Myxococcota bacterium]